MEWGTPEEVERRNRIRLAAAAYAYEVEHKPIMADGDFDALAQAIEPLQLTGRDDLDAFFMLEFEPDTGLWIWKHPDLEGVRRALTTWRRCGKL